MTGMDNLEDLRHAGLGLAIHAPFYMTQGGRCVMTFHFSDAIDAFRKWERGVVHPTIIGLATRELIVAPWCARA
jgi:hypothetical protein